MSKKVTFILLITIFLLSTTSAFAKRVPSWDFIQISYLDTKVDSIDGANFTGFDLALTQSFQQNFFFAANYRELKDDYTYDGVNYDVKGKGITAGIGYCQPLNATSGIFGQVSYEYNDSKININQQPVHYDDNGYSLEFGIRAMLTAKVEIFASVKHLDIANDKQKIFATNSFYHINHSLAIGLGYTVTDDLKNVMLSTRLSF